VLMGKSLFATAAGAVDAETEIHRNHAEDHSAEAAFDLWRSVEQPQPSWEAVG